MNFDRRAISNVNMPTWFYVCVAQWAFDLEQIEEVSWVYCPREGPVFLSGTYVAVFDKLTTNIVMHPSLKNNGNVDLFIAIRMGTQSHHSFIPWAVLRISG